MGLWQRLVRFGFRLLYYEMAFTYDLVSKVVSLGAWRCWQRTSLKHLNIEAGARVLELAHGTGDLQLDLHAAGYRAVGYDLSPNMGRIARKKLHKHGNVPQLTRGKAQQLPFADEAFAAVVSTFPTDFILAPETLMEVYRVLQRGGRLVIVPGSRFVSGGLVKRVLEWLYRITGQREDIGFDVEAHIAPFGYTVTVVEVPCPRSLVQVVIAEKVS